MADLAMKIEQALTLEQFRAWLDGIENREAMFNAHHCEMCALGHYVNSLTNWEPVLGITASTVFVSDKAERETYAPGYEDEYLLFLPEWASTFVFWHDDCKTSSELVSLPEVYRALEEAI